MQCGDAKPLSFWRSSENRPISQSASITTEGAVHCQIAALMTAWSIDEPALLSSEEWKHLELLHSRHSLLCSFVLQVGRRLLFWFFLEYTLLCKQTWNSCDTFLSGDTVRVFNCLMSKALYGTLCQRNLQTAFLLWRRVNCFSSTLRRRSWKTAFSLWKRIKYFPFTLHWRNLETQQSPVILDLCLRKPRAGKSRDYRDVISSVFELFSVHTKTQSNLDKLRFRDRLVWMVGPTVEIKLRFEIFLA